MSYSRQYGSLTGSRTFSMFASQTKVLSTPNTIAVKLEVVKNALRKSNDADNEHILMLLRGVVEQIENYCQLDFSAKSRRSLWTNPSQELVLPFGVHDTITSVVAIDSDAERTTLTSADYKVFGDDFKNIMLNRQYYNVEVTHSSGYVTAPNAVQAAIIQELSFQYKNRNDPNMGRIVSVNGLTLEARHLLMSGGFYRYA